MRPAASPCPATSPIPSHPPPVRRDHIVVIAADLGRRLRPHRDRAPRSRLLRHQRCLDARRDLALLTDPLLLQPLAQLHLPDDLPVQRRGLDRGAELEAQHLVHHPAGAVVEHRDAEPLLVAERNRKHDPADALVGVRGSPGGARRCAGKLTAGTSRLRGRGERHDPYTAISRLGQRLGDPRPCRAARSSRPSPRRSAPYARSAFSTEAHVQFEIRTPRSWRPMAHGQHMRSPGCRFSISKEQIGETAAGTARAGRDV